METVKAKFKVDSIVNYEHGAEVNMSACTTEEGDGMDFTPYTPSGNLSITIDKEAKAKDFFNAGDIVYLEFTKVN